MSDWRSDVLTFWFGLTPERQWKGDPAFDAEIRRRFEGEWTAKRQLPAQSFLDDPQTALAAVILFDQFPRNMFRTHADQFATDHLALAIARIAIERGFDDRLKPAERAFLYMPFEHSERIDDQDRSIALFTALGDDWLLGFAHKHRAMIDRFGRFPHRNALLGRTPRPEEVAAGDVFPW